MSFVTLFGNDGAEAEMRRPWGSVAVAAATTPLAVSLF